MAADWERTRTFYESLTLARDGDDTERYGAENYRLDERWPAYEHFWRCHVAPATERPASIAIREGVSRLVLEMAQANYQTFSHVVSACDSTAMLQTDLAFARVEDWRRLFTFHAVAIGSFAELVTSVSRLLATLGLPLGLLPPDRDEWRALSERHQTYQAYLANLEPRSIAWATDEGRRIALVLSPEAVGFAPPLAEPADLTTDSSRVRLVAVARLHLDNLIHILNFGSEQLTELLEPAQARREYHRLWGWYRG
jgi:hypothetical protein